MKKHVKILSILVLGAMLMTGCGADPVPVNTDSFSEESSVTIGVFTSDTETAANTETATEAETNTDTEVITDEPASALDESQADDCKSATVTLRMVGDILLHTPVEKAALREDGSYDYTAIFSHTQDLIREADLGLVNQEVIIGGEELGISGYPAFNAPYEIADALADAGFDVICHATNHALDKGKKGILNTLSYWEDHYPAITTLGIYDNEEASQEVTILTVNGIRIAFLNYTYGTNGISLPSDMPYCVELLDKERVIADLDKAEAEADFTVICPHWGVEYSLKPSTEQEKWCKVFMEHGADLVFGTHPHVIEPIEEMTDDSGHSMLVYYSLGNFVNWTSGTGEGVANRMVGGMADVTLEKDKDGTVFIADYDVIPLVTHVTKGTDGVTVYPLSEYTEELGQTNEIRIQDSTFSYDYCVDLTEKIWGEALQ